MTLSPSRTVALMVTLVVSKGSGSRMMWPCTSATVAVASWECDWDPVELPPVASLDETKERPVAVVVRVKL